MKPKDLLEYLETGDRSAEDLKYAVTGDQISIANRGLVSRLAQLQYHESMVAPSLRGYEFGMSDPQFQTLWTSPNLYVDEK